MDRKLKVPQRYFCDEKWFLTGIDLQAKSTYKKRVIVREHAGNITPASENPILRFITLLKAHSFKSPRNSNYSEFDAILKS